MNVVSNFTNCCLRRGQSLYNATARPGLLHPQVNGSFFQLQQRFISKYISKSAKKRIPLTTKRAGKGYYKGNGSTKEGRLTSKGKFLSDPRKKVELMVPDLEGFNVSFLFSMPCLCFFQCGELSVDQFNNKITG